MFNVSTNTAGFNHEHWKRFCSMKLRIYVVIIVGRDSSVGVVTRYGLDGPGIKSCREYGWITEDKRIQKKYGRGGGARFFAPLHTSPGAHPASYKMRTDFLYLGVKRPGRGVNHPIPSSAEVEERVEL